MRFWDKVCQIQQRQTAKGIKTYGKTLEENTEPGAIERIEHIEEELIDALMYLEWLKEKLGENNDRK